MAPEAPGICPNCERHRGAVGSPCPTEVCHNKNYHLIPVAWFEAARQLAVRKHRPMDPLLGRYINRYLLAGKLGEGGMGAVYVGIQRPLDREVAVKLISGVDVSGGAISRFEREARAIGLLDHPNIVKLFDYGVGNLGFQVPYMALEYVRHGRTLRQVFTRVKEESGGTVPVTLVLQVFRQILNALASAHEIGLVHRDMKPDNVLIVPVAGNPYFVKVLDFGLAKAVSEVTGFDGDISRTGLVLGTPCYMAPEQAHISGRRFPVDGRADLYSVAVMLYEVFTGIRPFNGESALAILASKSDPNHRPMEFPEALALPASLRTFLQRGMSDQATDRFSDAFEMLAALEQVLSTRGLKAMGPAAGDAGSSQERPATPPSPAPEGLPVEPVPVIPGPPAGSAEPSASLEPTTPLHSLLPQDADGGTERLGSKSEQTWKPIGLLESVGPSPAAAPKAGARKDGGRGRAARGDAARKSATRDDAASPDATAMMETTAQVGSLLARPGETAQVGSLVWRLRSSRRLPWVWVAAAAGVVIILVAAVALMRTGSVEDEASVVAAPHLAPRTAPAPSTTASAPASAPTPAPGAAAGSVPAPAVAPTAEPTRAAPAVPAPEPAQVAAAVPAQAPAVAPKAVAEASPSTASSGGSLALASATSVAPTPAGPAPATPSPAASAVVAPTPRTSAPPAAPAAPTKVKRGFVVETRPRGAVVVVDGETLGRSPIRFEFETTPKDPMQWTVSVGASAPGYRSASVNPKLADAVRNGRVRVVLEPEAKAAAPQPKPKPPAQAQDPTPSRAAPKPDSKPAAAPDGTPQPPAPYVPLPKPEPAPSNEYKPRRL